MNYKKTYVPASGYTKLSAIGDCGMQTLEFGIIELSGPGEACEYDTGGMETAFILLAGKATFEFDGRAYRDVGERRSVFEGKPAAVYMPRGKKVRVTSPWHVKIAVCATPVDEDTEPQLVLPGAMQHFKLGVKPFERDSTFIIDGTTNAKRLCIGEGFITPGNWGGFPPHKHDVSNMPAEARLEEIYYFLFDPPQGFGVQCMYTADGSMDEAYRVKHNDLVVFPYGYHTTVDAPGYNMYLLWLMAGEHQGFYRSNDPQHQWVSALENVIKKL